MSTNVPTIAELLDQHVSLRIESVDRIYLNGYLEGLQTSGGLVHFLAQQRNSPIPSPAMLGKMTREFVNEVEDFAAREGMPMIAFERKNRKNRKERKEKVAAKIRGQAPLADGVNFVGVAQEKQTAFKARTIHNNGRVAFEYSRQSAYVKHFYFYLEDAEFGPAFIKVGTYFPFPVRVCLNGHEWAKRQLEKEVIGHESLDNGFRSCANPARLQEICDSLGPEQIQAFFAKWIGRLPWPLSPQDRQAGHLHELSVWQVEYSRTDVFERPVRGREFFEEVIRENLDLGRPDRVQLLFERRIQKNTPGRFRTRVITDGVAPSLHVEYKHTGIKQYFKEGRALRTETTINDAGDFAIGRRLKNLPAMLAIARNTNRRMLEVERVSQNCVLSAASVQRLTQPSVHTDGQRAPGLKLADPRVMALLAALCLFLHLPSGFRNRDLRKQVAALMGKPLEEYRASQMTYDLRRLRLKGIVCRQPGTTRYCLTPYGLRASLFVTRLHARMLRPAFASIEPGDRVPTPLAAALDRVDAEIQRLLELNHLQPKKAA